MGLHGIPLSPLSKLDLFIHPVIYYMLFLIRPVIPLFIILMMLYYGTIRLTIFRRNIIHLILTSPPRPFSFVMNIIIMRFWGGMDIMYGLLAKLPGRKLTRHQRVIII